MKNHLNMDIPINFIIIVVIILVLLLCENGFFFFNVQNGSLFGKFRAGVIVAAIDFHDVFIAQFFI